MKNLINLFKDESGQGMVEYGLIIAVVALVVVVALTAVGTNLSDKFDGIKNALTPSPKAAS
ncbi:Flp/Fap pilin component [uncultured Eubacteriales bacterium]|uniref:Flp/Fap pilin component n=1 Tax=uncultured Eubacteriales bacterium TaxID=172733 RepID=A0A212JE83_9FIRM|nr:Flp/Fap pilin component [uncultured Eubacteriales bacterium]